MAPISIDFLSNVSPFLRGTDDVEAALDDVGKSLDDVAKDGKSSTDKLAASGESAAEKIERSFSELRGRNQARPRQHRLPDPPHLRPNLERRTPQSRRGQERGQAEHFRDVLELQRLRDVVR